MTDAPDTTPGGAAWWEPLRTRAGLRLSHAWGVTGARLASAVWGAWREDGTFVAVDADGNRVLEFDPRCGTYRRIALPLAGPRSNLWALSDDGRVAVVMRQEVGTYERSGLCRVDLAPGGATEDFLENNRRCFPDAVSGVTGAALFGGDHYWKEFRVGPLDSADSEALPQLEGSRAPASFSPDGSRVVGACGDDYGVAPDDVGVWDASTGELLARASAGGEVTDVCSVSPTEALFLVRSRGLCRWDLRAPEVEALVPHPPGDHILSARGAGDEAAVVTYGGAVRWYRGGALTFERSGVAWPRSAWVAPDLSCAVLLDGCNLLGVTRDRADPTGADDGPAMASALALRDDGRALAVADGARVRVWELDHGACTALLEADHGLGFAALAFSPSEAAVHACASDGTLVTWGLASGAEVGRAKLGYLGANPWLVVAPDGSWLALSTDRDRKVFLRGDRGGAELDGGAPASALAFDPTGAFLLIARNPWKLTANRSDGCRVERVDRDGRVEPLTMLPMDAWDAPPCAFPPDGRSLFAEDPSARPDYDAPPHYAFFDLAAGAFGAPVAMPVGTSHLHVGARFVTYATRRGVLGRLDPATGERDELDLSGAGADVAALAVSRDGDRVAVALSTGAVLVFDAG